MENQTVTEPITIEARPARDYTKVIDVVTFPIKALAWVVGLAIRGGTWIIVRFRVYDPVVSEKTKCPACGYRGSRLNFIRTRGVERGAIQHDCLMCGAQFYSPLLKKADSWLPLQQ